MRVALMLAGSLVASQALAQDAGSQVSQTTPPSTAAGPTVATHAQLLDAYPQGLADRPRAIGAGLFEAGWDGSWQFNSSQGFGEAPDVRYGISDQVEVTLLGVRYIPGRGWPEHSWHGLEGPASRSGFFRTLP